MVELFRLLIIASLAYMGSIAAYYICGMLVMGMTHKKACEYVESVFHL